MDFFFVTIIVAMCLLNMLFTFLFDVPCNGKFSGLQLHNSHFDILPMSKSLVTSKLFNLEVFIKYVVQLILMFCVMVNFQSCSPTANSVLAT